MLYVSADRGARLKKVKARFLQICERLELEPPTIDRLALVETPVKLNDPKSVADLLLKNPGAFVLVVIDPLFRCVNGDLSRQEIIDAVDTGLTTIADATGAALLILHHEPHLAGRPFGSVFIGAGGDAQVHVVRHSKGNVLRDGDPVTVTVEWLKNDDPAEVGPR